MPAVVEQLLPPQLWAYLSQPSREPEHRTVAVAFLRFDGPTPSLRRMVRRCSRQPSMKVLRNVQEATAAHDVSFLDTDVDVNGGKILLVGGAPRSAGDDTDRLLTAVRGPSIGRAGCHCRPAYRTAGCSRVTPAPQSPDVFGEGRRRKPRRPLAAHAESGSILMAADVLEHTRRSYASMTRHGEPEGQK